MNPRLLVIGLDGATWRLLDPLISDGELPNLKEIIQEGCRGDLRSSNPPVTFPAWKCLSTGMNPGKIGIYQMVRIKNKSLSLNRADDCEKKDLWDYIGQKTKVAVINTPITYPPREVNGVLVSGPFSPDLSCFPNSFKGKLKEIGYSNSVDKFLMAQDKESEVKSLKETIGTRFDLLDEIIGEFGFVWLTIFLTDTVQHFLWDLRELEEVWKYVDKKIGELVDKLPRTDILIVSDHGFIGKETTFYINSWLRAEGYLEIKGSILRLLINKIGFNRKRVYDILSKTPFLGIIKKTISKFFLKKIARAIPGEGGSIGLEGAMGLINWEGTKAIANGRLVYLQDKSLQKEIRKKLNSIENPLTGEKAVKRVYSKDEIYSGSHLEEAPDLVIKFNKKLEVSDDLGVKENFKSLNRKANHDYNGIIVAKGPDFKNGEGIENATVYDIAPTVLDLFGLSVPGEMDGKVLREILKSSQ